MGKLYIYSMPFYVGSIKAFHYVTDKLMYKTCKLTSTILELIFLLYIGFEVNEPGRGQRVFNRICIQIFVGEMTF